MINKSPIVSNFLQALYEKLYEDNINTEKYDSNNKNDNYLIEILSFLLFGTLYKSD